LQINPDEDVDECTAEEAVDRYTAVHIAAVRCFAEYKRLFLQSDELFFELDETKALLDPLEERLARFTYLANKYYQRVVCLTDTPSALDEENAFFIDHGPTDWTEMCRQTPVFFQKEWTAFAKKRVDFNLFHLEV
jgi:hypothetical protein